MAYLLLQAQAQQYSVDSQVATPKPKATKRKSGVTPSMTRNKVGGKKILFSVLKLKHFFIKANLS